MTAAQEKEFEEIAAKAIRAAEVIDVNFDDFVEGLGIIHIELGDRLRSAEAEQLAHQTDDGDNVEDME